jgi:hypothetical protein
MSLLNSSNPSRKQILPHSQEESRAGCIYNNKNKIQSKENSKKEWKNQLLCVVFSVCDFVYLFGWWWLIGIGVFSDHICEVTISTNDSGSKLQSMGIQYL